MCSAQTRPEWRVEEEKAGAQNYMLHLVKETETSEGAGIILGFFSQTGEAQ